MMLYNLSDLSDICQSERDWHNQQAKKYKASNRDLFYKHLSLAKAMEQMLAMLKASPAHDKIDTSIITGDNKVTPSNASINQVIDKIPGVRNIDTSDNMATSDKIAAYICFILRGGSALGISDIIGELQDTYKLESIDSKMIRNKALNLVKAGVLQRDKERTGRYWLHPQYVYSNKK